MNGLLSRYGWTATWVALAFGSRAAVGLSISALIFGTLASEQSSGLFQLIFLQSVFIALISASGFVRSVKHSHEGGDSSVQLKTYSSFVAKASLAALIVGLVFLPRRYLGISPFEQTMVCLLLIAGGALAALSGILQGAVVLLIGKSRTFGCIAGANLVSFAAVAVFAIIPDPVAAAFALFVSQALGFIALFAFVPEARKIVLGAVGAQSMRGNDAMLSTGLINAVQLLSLFAAREFWKGNVAADIASLVFFLIRISDMILQVFYIIFSSTPRFVEAFSDRITKISTFSIAVMISAIPVIVYIFVSESQFVHFAFAVILLEISIFTPRLMAAMMSISMLYSKNLIYYILSIASSICALAFFISLRQAAGALTMQLAMFAMAIGILASGFLVKRLTVGR